MKEYITQEFQADGWVVADSSMEEVAEDINSQPEKYRHTNVTIGKSAHGDKILILAVKPPSGRNVYLRVGKEQVLFWDGMWWKCHQKLFNRLFNEVEPEWYREPENAGNC